ncbi:MAG: agmatinase family protein [Bdellovibrionales bacterium]|nr:agmatinase family protein [Bdellovibrionales bacterium]
MTKAPTDTNSIAQGTQDGGIFALPTSHESAQIILTAVPWEVTTSYGGGTSLGPKAIFNASPQVDLFDIEFGEPYVVGYHLDDEDPFFMKTNSELKILAQSVIQNWNETGSLSAESKKTLEKVNIGCAEMVSRVYQKTLSVLAENKIPGLIGGDHSTPLGAIKALSEKYDGRFGVLHIDAHADLRLAYQGFTHSHASIMRNVCLLKTAPKKLVQVGIRDFCKEEYDFIKQNEGRISTYFDNDNKTALFKNAGWDTVCHRIVDELPENVYVSFDIDGLSPEFCPNTGTPVPGGLSFEQATYLLSVLGRSGKKIVGFDLNEVAPGENGEWDGNVGARMLFKLCGWAAVTNGFGK